MDYDWKFLEVTEKLMNYLAPPPPPNGPNFVRLQKGLQATELKLERRKLWVIEGIPRIPSYCYSKRLWYLDPEAFWILTSINFDRRGQIWKEFTSVFTGVPDKRGGYTQINCAGRSIDFLIGESAPWYLDHIETNSGLDLNIFSIDYLRRMGR
jgi:hypothetical protein